MKNISLFLCILLLTGCANNCVKEIKTQTVLKPVYTVPENLKQLPIVECPDLPTNHFTVEDKKNHDKVSKSIITSFAIMQTCLEKYKQNENVFREFINNSSVEEPPIEHK